MKNESFAFNKSIEIFGLENPIASGMTTCLFRKKDLLEGVSVDFVKKSYMENMNLPLFKVIYSIEEKKRKGVWNYEIQELQPLNKEESEKLSKTIDSFHSDIKGLKLTFNSNSNEYASAKKHFGETFANALSEVYRKYTDSNIYLDVTIDQFLKFGNEIICVDAVMDRRIYGEILATN